MKSKKLNTKGKLEIICGPMFSGKTEEQIRRLRRAKLAGKQTLAFKHCLDNRKTIDHLVSHNGSQIKAFAASDAETIVSMTPDEVSFIGIDEIQFFSHQIIQSVVDLVENGKHIIASGLDMDFRGNPFGCMPTLLAIADDVTKLASICSICGENARLSQRLVNGAPAKYEDQTIMVGASETYQARCRDCYEINRPSVQIINQHKFI